MRISGGQLKGRTLQSPKGTQTRPTSTQVRAAIFNILGHDLGGLRVLDLFAGAGGLGIEALSRGAASCVFVESHRLALDALKRNLQELNLTAQGLVFPVSLPAAWPRIAKQAPFDAVFADPPYDLSIEGRSAAFWVLQQILKAPWYTPDIQVVIESDSEPAAPIDLPANTTLQIRRYGGTYLWLLQKIS